MRKKVSKIQWSLEDFVCTVKRGAESRVYRVRYSDLVRLDRFTRSRRRLKFSGVVLFTIKNQIQKGITS